MGASQYEGVRVLGLKRSKKDYRSLGSPFRPSYLGKVPYAGACATQSGGQALGWRGFSV